MDTTIKPSEVTRARKFEITPDADTREAMAARLGILGLRKVSFRGDIAPDGAADWRLTARLGATVVQACVVTLEPVSTRIEDDIVRRYLSELPEVAEASEIVMPEDETAEAAPDVIDLAVVMEEALALALPDWPRKDGLDHVAVSVTEADAKPLTDADVKPFAALKSLKERMGDTGSGET